MQPSDLAAEAGRDRRKAARNSHRRTRRIPYMEDESSQRERPTQATRISRCSLRPLIYDSIEQHGAGGYLLDFRYWLGETDAKGGNSAMIVAFGMFVEKHQSIQVIHRIRVGAGGNWCGLGRKSDY
jgi:hypothetical protein